MWARGNPHALRNRISKNKAKHQLYRNIKNRIISITYYNKSNDLQLAAGLFIQFDLLNHNGLIILGDLCAAQSFILFCCQQPSRHQHYHQQEHWTDERRAVANGAMRAEECAAHQQYPHAQPNGVVNIAENNEGQQSS